MAPPKESLWRSIRSLPRPIWFLYLGTFVNRFGSFVSVFLVLYLVHRGYTVAQAGLALSAYGVGSLVAATAGGFLADRVGRRRTIVASMFGAAASALALSQASGYAGIVLLTAAFGMTSELYRPASSALITDLVEPDRRLPAFAGYRLAINAGFAFGPAVAGFLAERSFFYLFVGEAATSAVLGLVALVALPEGTRAPREQERRGESIRVIVRDVKFVLFLVAGLFAAFVYFQSESTLPLHVRAQGLPTSVFGLLISLNGLLIVFLEFPLVGVTRRFSAPRVIATGVALSGLGFGLTAVAHSVPPLVLTVVVWTFGEMITAPVASTYVANMAPAHLRGRYNGAFGLMFALAFVLAPAVGARLFAWSPTGLWVTCAILGIVGGALVLVEPRRRIRVEVPVVEPGPEIPGGPR